MLSLWRTFRRLLAVLPEGTRRFVIRFAVLQSALAVLDVAALGLLAALLGPLLTGSTLRLPVLGEIGDDRVLGLLLLVGALIVSKSVLAILLQRWATRRFATFEQALGGQLLDATFRAPWTERLKRNASDIVRSTDVGVGATVAGVLIPACQLAGEVMTFVAVLAVLVVAEPVLASATVVYFALVALVLYAWVLRRAVKAGQDNRAYSARAVRVLAEMVHALKEITLRERSAELSQLVLGVRSHASRARADQSFLGAIPRYVLEAGLVGGLGIGAAIGYAQSGSAAGALAAVALFGVAGFRIVPSLTRFQTILAQTGANTPFAEQVLTEIERSRRYTAVPEHVGSAPLPDDAASLRLQDVTFTYPGSGTPAVAGVSLELTFGSTLALVGASGSGKSTLVDLMLGLLEPDDGRLLVGDAPLPEVLRAWRSRVGYVPQEVALFDASVAHNVALAWREEDVDDDRVRRALERAQLLEHVEARPEGIHAPVGDRGLALSGGQRQRLGIARALYTDPLVLVLDEATSALDTSTEAAVTEAIRDLAGEMSVVVVAHRLATIRHSDQVCFLSGGALVASGTFDDVVAAVPDFAAQAALAGLTGPTGPRGPTPTLSEPEDTRG